MVLDKLDFIFAADVFYDPSVFEPFVGTLCRVFEIFPNAQCLFTYEEREFVFIDFNKLAFYYGYFWVFLVYDS